MKREREKKERKERKMRKREKKEREERKRKKSSQLRRPTEIDSAKVAYFEVTSSDFWR